VDEEGNIYITDYDNAAVRKIAPNGDVITIAAPRPSGGADASTGVSAPFKGPNGIAYGRWRGVPTLFVADDRDNRVRTINLSDPTHPVSNLELNRALDGPSNLDWWAESDPVFDEWGNIVWHPRDRGYVFVTDRNGIYRAAENEDGTVSLDQIAPGTKARSVYSDDLLNLWIVPLGRNTIEKIDYIRDYFLQPIHTKGSAPVQWLCRSRTLLPHQVPAWQHKVRTRSGVFPKERLPDGAPLFRGGLGPGRKKPG
jgi:hypothetical protein